MAILVGERVINVKAWPAPKELQYMGSMIIKGKKISLWHGRLFNGYCYFKFNSVWYKARYGDVFKQVFREFLSMKGKPAEDMIRRS